MADLASTSTANGGPSICKSLTKDDCCRIDRLSLSIDQLTQPPQRSADSLSNGPVASALKNETAKTSSEFDNLSSARRPPTTPAATGQPLTHYHSFFSELLSWNNPRASGITYASIVVFILATRYLNIIRWGFKLTWMLLGFTVAAETAGKLLLGNGLASKFRPRKYYTLSRETLDSAISDVHELLNFFVIEAQRIVFVENVYASLAACAAALLSYFLVKIVPYWGLSLLGTTVLFFAPLIYKTNQEVIDQQLKQASDIVNAQTAQLRKTANKHTAHATELTKQYVGDYTAKAQHMIRGSKATPAVPTTASVTSAPTATVSTTQFKESDFPVAPQGELTTEAEPSAAAASSEEEPLIHA